MSVRTMAWQAAWPALAVAQECAVAFVGTGAVAACENAAAGPRITSGMAARIDVPVLIIFARRRMQLSL